MDSVLTSDPKLRELEKQIEKLTEAMKKEIKNIKTQRDIDALTEIAKLRRREAEIFDKAVEDIEKVRKKHQPQIKVLEEQKRKRMDEIFKEAFSKKRTNP